MEGFGRFEGVIKGKSEMHAYLAEHKKIAFVNMDDAIQVEKTEGIERCTFGGKSNETNVVIDFLSHSIFSLIVPSLP